MAAIDSYTKLLLHLNMPRFIDQSAAPKTVTAYGGATSSTDQSVFGGCSLSLDGVDDYLSIPDSDDFYFGTGDLTIDFWVWFKSLPSQIDGDEWPLYCQHDDIADSRMGVWVGASGTGDHYLFFGALVEGSGYFTVPTDLTYTTLVINTWYHIAVVKNGDDYSVYLNGSRFGNVATYTPSLPNVAAPVWIGKDFWDYYTDAYIDEFRVSKGVARWTANFTPPSASYESDAYTVLLLHFFQDPFIDSSLTPKTVTVTGADVTLAKIKFGSGSAYFDGTDDFLSLSDSDDWYFDGDFTVDFWVNLPSLLSGGVNKFFFSQDAGDYVNVLALGFYWTGSRLEYRLQVYPDQNVLPNAASGITETNTWYHVAVVGTTDGQNQTTKVYTNGVLKVTSAVYSSNNVSAPFLIGQRDSTFLSMYLAEFRVSKGIVRWSANFTPPSAPYGDPVVYYETITDDVILSDTSDWQRLIAASEVADSIYIRDTALYRLAVTVQESLGLSDMAAAMLCVLVNDYLLATETQTVNQSGTKTISDSLTLTDTAHSALHLSISDTAAISDTSTVQLCLSILEHLGFNELVTAIGHLSHGVSDTIAVQDSLQFGFSQAVSDTLTAVDVAAVIGALVNSIAESLSLADTATNQMTMSLPVAETLTIADTVSSQGILYNIVYDTLKMSVTVEVDGEVWECFVLNTPKFLPSVYSGFDFNSYCVFENRAYGCKSDGIYELTGDTDNGVAFHTGVQMPDTTFGIPNQKRFQKAYVGVSGTSPKMVMQTEDGSKKVYSIDSDGEVDASRALKSKKWKLTVTDFDTLDFIKLYPVVLAK